MHLVLLTRAFCHLELSDLSTFVFWSYGDAEEMSLSSFSDAKYGEVLVFLSGAFPIVFINAIHMITKGT